MPFELTHIAIAEQVLKQAKRTMTSQLLAGLLYPDIRYPFHIDRQLTHTMAGLLDPSKDDFAYGVWLHLKTDSLWDDQLLLHGDIKIDEVGDKTLFIGLLKIVHDKLCFPKIIEPKSLATLLTQSTIPLGLIATGQQWQEWTTALAKYLDEGPTREGWKHIVTAMKYVDPSILDSNYEKVEMFELRYSKPLNAAFKAIVKRI